MTSDSLKSKVAGDNERDGRLESYVSQQYRPGDSVLNRFTIKDVLGKGAFGVVYLAEDPEGNQVALKNVLHLRETEDRGVRDCIDVIHPNLVRYLDICYDDDDDLWIEMEYVRGQTLAELIAKCPSGMSREEAFKIIHAVCVGVDHLHQHRIIHRDLKPANVLLNGQVVKVGDVGIAKKMVTGDTGVHTLIGTPNYMAPEIQHGDASLASDVYALGVMLYEMLTGSLRDLEQILQARNQGASVVTKLDRPLQAAISRAVARDPQERYSSVLEFWQAVETAAQSVGPNGTRGKPESTQGPAPRAARSRTWREQFVALVRPSFAFTVILAVTWGVSFASNESSVFLFGMTVYVAVLILLALAMRWEDQRLSFTQQQIVFGITGAFLGTFSYSVGRWLLIQPFGWPSWISWIFTVSGDPSWTMAFNHIGYFSGLFLFPAVWVIPSRTRQSRFAPVPVALFTGWGLIWGVIFAVHFWWALLWPFSVSLLVQLSRSHQGSSNSWFRYLGVR